MEQTLNKVQQEIANALRERAAKMADPQARAEDARQTSILNKQRRAARRWAEGATREENSRFARYCNSRPSSDGDVLDFGDMSAVAEALTGQRMERAALLEYWSNLLGYKIADGEDIDYFARCASTDGWCLQNGVPIED